MAAVRVFFVLSCFLLICAQEDDFDVITEPNETKPLQLFPPNPTYAGQTRMPRTLFKKLHSKAAFLTGLKLGAILSKKGFELGHGKIASTHSFQIFGKSVNSAMSLSYGNPESLLPLVDDEGATGGDQRIKKDEVFRVTVIERPSNETTDDVPEKKSEATNSAVVLYQDFVEESPEQETDTNFIAEHNKRVKEINESISRRKNSRF